MFTQQTKSDVNVVLQFVSLFKILPITNEDDKSGTMPALSFRHVQTSILATQRACADIQGGPAKVRPTYIFDGNI